MNKNKVIMIGGKEYPCRITMGSMVRFKNQTGHDISKIDGTDLGEIATFMWCCVKSSCVADDIEFNLNMEEFADRLDVENVTAFSQLMAADVEKKTV